MNEPWSIPRASLGSNSNGSNSSNKSNSNPSSIKVHSKKSRGHTNPGYSNEENLPSGSSGSDQERKRPPSKTLEELQNKFDEFSSRSKYSSVNIHSKNGNNDEKQVVTPKRGSRSSQGSTESNHSSHVSIFMA